LSAKAWATAQSTTAVRISPFRTAAFSISGATARTAPISHRRRRMRRASRFTVASSAILPGWEWRMGAVMSGFPFVQSSVSDVACAGLVRRPNCVSALSIKGSSRRFSQDRIRRSTVEAWQPSSRAMARIDIPSSVCRR
jgi:hypothetical protein